MTSDAKLGLLAGIVGVVMVAVVYFPKPAEGSVAALPTRTAEPAAAAPEMGAKPVAAVAASAVAGPVPVSLTSRTTAGD
jgi:hypothetical protein